MSLAVFVDLGIVLYIRILLYSSASYPLHEHSINKIVHLDDVACYGNESKLSECQHRGIGINSCTEGIEEAGVICSGEFQFLDCVS